MVWTSQDQAGIYELKCMANKAESSLVSKPEYAKVCVYLQHHWRTFSDALLRMLKCSWNVFKTACVEDAELMMSDHISTHIHMLYNETDPSR